MKTEKPVAHAQGGRPTLYKRIKRGLAAVTQLIITAPTKLPPKLVAGAKYVALLVGLLDALEHKPGEKEGGGDGS